LLADEPTGNLDEGTAEGIIDLLKRTAHEIGKCVIVVTHSRRLAKESDRIIQLQR
ncbi:MAG: ABC transporter ATP-binding protein, partial [[Clostridium] scindens]